VLRTYWTFIAGIILTSLLLCLAIEWYGFNYIPSKHTQIAEVYIPPGSSIHTIANILHSQGVLERPRAFVFIARLENVAPSLKAGEYFIPTDITPSQLLRFLVAGKVHYREITFVEGWRFSQMLESLEKNPYLQHHLQGKTPQEIMTLLGEADKNPEGRFYPNTFKFARGTNDLVLLKKSHQLMLKQLAKAWEQRAPNLPYQSPGEAVIVASLIEKETAVAAERAVIAGVILRRLQNRMLLQIDPTVIYALGENYSGHLSREDLKVNSPYNTYLFKGLPPTPIAMPSLASVMAALHPLEGTVLYYVSKGDGTHVFSSTLAEHNEAVNKLRQRSLLNTPQDSIKGKSS
jgi:UPF0755 protein